MVLNIKLWGISVDISDKSDKSFWFFDGLYILSLRDGLATLKDLGNIRSSILGILP